eukprot:scaffold33988_cov146-Skeletonema_marinoi.AAC.2
MINLVQLSKSANRISCNGVIVIMMSIASSLFAIKIHRIIISLDAQAPHIQKLSSSINLELFGGSNSSTSGFNNSTYVSPHQDQIVHEVKISSTSTEPMFVLHIGPHKTATSVIQCDLTRYRKELYETASVAYVGRIYSHCLNRRNNKHTLDPRSLINSCFKNGNCETKDAWKSLESELAYLSAHNKHVILSDEAFARMHVTSYNQKVDNRQMLYKLVNKYYPGRMRVVVVYRRYYEWMLSLWNEFNKPFKNGNGDTSDYRPTYQNWPSEGGKRCHTFVSFMKKFMDPEGKRTSDEYRHRAEAEHVHVAEYFRGLWSNHSSEVQVLNLHEMNVPSDDGQDATSRFLQSALTPLAAKTYTRSKDSGFGGRHNPSRNINYDILAVAAHEHGLLANQTIPRAKVAVLLEEHFMKKLNTTDLPLQCPDEELLKRFLQKPIHYEEMLYPGQTDDKEHETTFYEAVKRHKFCNFDFDALEEDEAVRTFFSKEIPRLYRRSKH